MLDKSTLMVFLLFADELIRQVTINCAERGILLLRWVHVSVCVCAFVRLYA